jgi:acetyl esterase/lipase
MKVTIRAMLGSVAWLMGLPVVAWALLWGAARCFLRGPDHSAYDALDAPTTVGRPQASPELAEVMALMDRRARTVAHSRLLDALAFMRRDLDEVGQARPIDAAVFPTNAGGVSAEWVLAPNARPERRLLYLPGGGFVVGSPRSHRAITARLSRAAAAAVLAVDYRLMPEHPRTACIQDCRDAYRWILEHGPPAHGGEPAALRPASRPAVLLVAGDSAGGNLALMCLAWARDQGLRRADAALVMSPATDLTLASPSLRSNAATDVMLGPMLRPLTRVPRAMLLWLCFVTHRMNPRDPQISPLLGDLSGLPPVLVHASESEMLLQDSVRYVNKARASGTDAVLQTWPAMPHVWHAFVGHLPEAEEAFRHMERWLAERLGGHG